jgi:antitoxin component of MazEF toxin-antitoxin module
MVRNPQSLPVDPVISRLTKNGASACVILPKPLLEYIRWPLGSIVAIRTAGEKLILERIPLEEFARIRVGLTEVRPEST